MSLQIRSIGTAAQQANYESTVRPIIEIIRATDTGKIVLGHIERSSRRVRIVPFGARDAAELGFNNAFTDPMGISASGTFGAGATAAGTGSEIHFSVGNLRNRGIQGRNDEVLMHELCHGLRQVSGAMQFAGSTSGPIFQPIAGGFDNVEEFFAAMVTSVYSSELGRPALGNHNRSGLRNPDALRRPPFSTRLKDFRRRMPGFVQAMAAISPAQAPFNPFRDVPV